MGSALRDADLTTRGVPTPCTVLPTEPAETLLQQDLKRIKARQVIWGCSSLGATTKSDLWMPSLLHLAFNSLSIPHDIIIISSLISELKTDTSTKTFHGTA